MIDLAHRAGEPERMDQSELGTGELGAALRDLDRLASLLGGRRGEMRLLRRRLSERRGPVRILDVGAGSGQSARALAIQARRAGRVPRVVALDLHASACRIAAERSRGHAAVSVVRGDALHLPFPDGAFSLAHASLVLHHFGGDAPGLVLREMRRVARDGIVISDLRRSALSYWGVRCASRLLSRSEIVRHDAALSVRRAFRREEVEAWRALPGFAGLTVRRREPFRWLAWTFDEVSG